MQSSIKLVLFESTFLKLYEYYESFFIFYICCEIKTKHVSVYFAELTGKSVCVTADDNHVFILLLHVSIICNETLYVRQGTTSSRDGITYDNVNLLS